MQIYKVSQTLSDQSNVFDVVLNDGDASIIFPAVTSEDADRFIDGVRDLITRHTLIVVGRTRAPVRG